MHVISMTAINLFTIPELMFFINLILKNGYIFQVFPDLLNVAQMSLREIAATENIPLGTVKSRLNRGRRKLRDYLTQHVELLPARYRLYDETAGAGGLAHLFAVWGVDQALRMLRRGVDRYE